MLFLYEYSPCLFSLIYQSLYKITCCRLVLQLNTATHLNLIPIHSRDFFYIEQVSIILSRLSEAKSLLFSGYRWLLLFIFSLRYLNHLIMLDLFIAD